VTLRLGLLGCGTQGARHAAAIRALAPRTTLVAACDPRTERAAALGVDTVEDATALARRCDAVIVAAPVSEHAAACRTLLAAGVHVLCEKPLGSDATVARSLSADARATGRLLMVGFTERFNAAVEAFHEEDPGEILFIESERLSPFSDRGTDVDVVLDLMVHDLDFCLHAMGTGARISDVMGAGIPVLTDGVDLADARLHFASGAVARLSASRASVKRRRRMRVFHRGGYVSMDLDAGTAHVVRRTRLDTEASVLAGAPGRDAVGARRARAGGHHRAAGADRVVTDAASRPRYHGVHGRQRRKRDRSDPARHPRRDAQGLRGRAQGLRVHAPAHRQPH
jgi:predicted dehydrogenase